MTAKEMVPVSGTPSVGASSSHAKDQLTRAPTESPLFEIAMGIGGAVASNTGTPL